MNMQISFPTNERVECRHQRGYALLVIMFAVALLAATVLAAVPNLLTNGRREREEEMIWRGKQYARGVKLYNTKPGHFPTSLDDLTTPKTGSIHFMRQAYKDPMNKTDGSWRLIYVGPSGQLIGSLKPPENFQLPGAGGLGTSAAAVANASGGAPAVPGASGSGGFGSTSGGFGSSNSSSFGSSSFGSSNTSSFGSSSFGSTNNSVFGSPSSSANNLVDSNGQPIDPYLDPPVTDVPGTSSVVGGNIIGVASKINQHSIKVYEKAKNYLLFEFIWNPAKDAAAAMQQLNAPGTQGIGTPVGNGQTPFGQTPTPGPTSGPASGTPQGGTPPTSQPQPQPQNPPQQ
jgi:type II secretory pathway pseudopilin PulG